VCRGKANYEHNARFKALEQDKTELCLTSVPNDMFTCSGCVLFISRLSVALQGIIVAASIACYMASYVNVVIM
jgi:hypothetical protein